jgi:hypothetical protein
MLKTILSEFKRLWVFILIAGSTMFADPVAAQYILFGLGCISSILVFAHLVRKLLHTYVDFEWLYLKASETPLGAAIVLAVFMYLVTTVLNVAVQFVK